VTQTFAWNCISGAEVWKVTVTVVSTLKLAGAVYGPMYDTRALLAVPDIEVSEARLKVKSKLLTTSWT
jgi:hypothetical protein